MSPRSRAELEALVKSGATIKYLFFWGHQGGVGPACLSQWWPCRFEVEGQNYASAEHFMMAEKARLFKDDQRLAEILACSHPAEAKKLGRLVHHFDDQVWDAHRFDIVVRGNLAKFSQHPEARDYLLGTGRRVLVEASPRDRIWGIGLGRANPKAANPFEWRGQNLLGFALMEVRSKLIDC